MPCITYHPTSDLLFWSPLFPVPSTSSTYYNFLCILLNVISAPFSFLFAPPFLTLAPPSPFSSFPLWWSTFISYTFASPACSTFLPNTFPAFLLNSTQSCSALLYSTSLCFSLIFSSILLSSLFISDFQSRSPRSSSYLTHFSPLTSPTSAFASSTPFSLPPSVSSKDRSIKVACLSSKSAESTCSLADDDYSDFNFWKIPHVPLNIWNASYAYVI